MKTSNMAHGTVVLVQDEFLGVVQYTTPDGWYGVRLDGETRVDEWAPDQVQAPFNDA